MDQTYFGVELGVEAQLRERVPHNCVPHPMIVGSMIGLLGFHKMETFPPRSCTVPAHCLFYFTHMMQEQVRDIYAKDWGRRRARAAGRRRRSEPAADDREDGGGAPRRAGAGAAPNERTIYFGVSSRERRMRRSPAPPRGGDPWASTENTYTVADVEASSLSNITNAEDE